MELLQSGQHDPVVSGFAYGGGVVLRRLVSHAVAHDKRRCQVSVGSDCFATARVSVEYPLGDAVVCGLVLLLSDERAPISAPVRDDNVVLEVGGHFVICSAPLAVNAVFYRLGSNFVSVAV